MQASRNRCWLVILLIGRLLRIGQSAGVEASNHHVGQQPGMAQRRAATLRPADAPARGADCGGLPGRDHTRRVQRALAALFRGTVVKDVVSRAWRKVKADWEAWGRHDLGSEDIVRLILDG